MKPLKSILSKDFEYVPAAKTDLATTFERVRKRMEKEAEKERTERIYTEPGTYLLTLRKRANT